MGAKEEEEQNEELNEAARRFEQTLGGNEPAEE